MIRITAVKIAIIIDVTTRAEGTAMAANGTILAAAKEKQKISINKI